MAHGSYQQRKFVKKPFPYKFIILYARFMKFCVCYSTCEYALYDFENMTAMLKLIFDDEKEAMY